MNGNLKTATDMTHLDSVADETEHMGEPVDLFSVGLAKIHKTLSDLDAKEYSGLLIIYPIFIILTILLVLFFAVSLGLALTGPYFIDWGSAILGLLGSSGLVVVGWISKIQRRK